MTSAQYAALLRDKRWRLLRSVVIERHGSKCKRCGLGPTDGKHLHVHHREYRDGLLPWEYAVAELETLCAGCHALEHGLICPPSGWRLVTVIDLGDLVGGCEYCGTPLRYVFVVTHPQWVALDVGTDCCDRMTQTDVATATLVLAERRKRFVESSRWRCRGTTHRIKQEGIRVYILPWGERYRIRMLRSRRQSVLGQREYVTLDEAKGAAFDAIASGDAARVLHTEALR